MYCEICQRKFKRNRYARFEVIGLTGVRAGWRFYVCGIHVKKYRRQNGNYRIETSVLETMLRAMPAVVISGVLASAITQAQRLHNLSE